MIAAVACAGVLFAAGTARAEIVAKNATDGLLALSPAGVPSVAYVRGTRMVVATRAGKAKWRSVTAARTTPGATVKAFKIGAAGPVALVQSSDDHALLSSASAAPPGRPSASRASGQTMALGWPGLALDAKGLPVVAYARWNSLNLNTQLQFVRVGRAWPAEHSERDARRFPAQHGAAVGGAGTGRRPRTRRGGLRLRHRGGCVRVVSGREDWTGLGIDVSRGEFPDRPPAGRPRSRDASTPPGASPWPPSRPRRSRWPSG